MTSSHCQVLLMNLRDYTFQTGLRTEYLAFGYLAGALRARGYGVTWLDENTDGPYSPDSFDFRGCQPVRIVGMSPSFATYRRAIEWLRRWKREYPDIITVLGGQHVMMVPDEVLRESDAVDYVCLGEGEEPLCRLADAVSAGRTTDEVPGFAFRREGKIVWGDRLDPPPPLDDLPWPARDSLEKWIDQKRISQVSVQNSRGCRFGCGFCHFPGIRGRGYGYDGRFRSPAGVARELVHLCDTYRVREFFFNSPQFGGRYRGDKQWMFDFADELILLKRDIRFEIECRSDTLDDPQLVAKLAQAGLIRVFLGLEAGNSGMLRAYGKGVSVDTHKRVITSLRSNGIAISGSGFIMLHPLTAFENLRENAEFLWEIGDAHIHTLWSRFRLFPGIAQERALKKLGLVDPGRRHDDVLAYRFNDPIIESMARNMTRALSSPLLSPAERLVRLVDIEIGLEEANLPAIAPVPAQGLRELIDIRESSRGLRDAILTAFFDHFIHCLRIAGADGRGEGWDRAAERLHRHISALKPKIDAALGQHDSLLLSLVRGRFRRGRQIIRDLV